jgi:solute carrier family 25 carnitine/acylcarnitine transporter 20/29
MFTGVVSSLVIAPTEHIKCRLQVGSTNKYRGSIDAIKRIIASHGVFRLYRGLGATILRQSPSFGIYFGTYDRIKRAICHRFGTSSESSQHSDNKRRLAASALAGGFAGSLAWAVVYPMDIIKSRIQTMPLEKPASIGHVAQTLYASGWRSFYRGVGITVLRAFPVNGIIFPVYEFSLQQLNGTFSTPTQTADDIIGTTIVSYKTIKR